MLFDEFHNTRSASASVISRRQSSHLQTDVDKSEILSVRWDKNPRDKREQFESTEFERGNPEGEIPAFAVPSSPALQINCS